MAHYDFKSTEKKWQEIWDKEKTFECSDDYSKPKFYGLVEFPYPSGAGMHVGHIKAYSGLEVVSRKRRLQGYNVLFPIGFDAFGLPTENYAIKTNTHPRIVTDHNIKRFTEQLKMVGFSFDWSKVIDTTQEDYYKWTQWIFLKMFEHGLVFRDKALINYCPSCKVVLSNEDSQGGKCDVCHSEIIQKSKDVWYLCITAYADKLLEGLKHVDYLPNIKLQQENWIGKSTGAFVEFKIKDTDDKIYTTRPDTLFGVTFMVMAPEHPLIDKYASMIGNMDAVADYRNVCAKKSAFERTQLVKDKTGVKLDGFTAVNPVNGKEIPIWLSDYVLMTYGTGAIMAVPAHDTRDWEFAHKFGIPMIEVVAGGNIEEAAYTDIQDGVMVNSGFLDGMKVAKEAIIEYLEKNGLGEKKVNYKLRDWVFSRQRYWGEPIPIVHCDKCGMVAVPEDQLPVTLPMVDNYEPTDSGESPLSVMHDWVNTTCPCCGGPATRETDTMPQWAGSSWYFMRYCDPHCETAIASPEALRYWLPVDWYNGGMEHTTLHLLYSRFWHLFLHDIGVIPAPEPYQKRTSHGMILGENGEKMSKSRGNVVNPDDIIDEIGADAFRVYEMFMGAFDQAIPWSTQSAKGCRRFLDRVWRLQENVTPDEGYSEKLNALMHETIKKVSLDYEAMKYNTAIAQMMTLVNEMVSAGSVTRGELKTLLLLLNPVAPHITEEMWENQGFGGTMTYQKWPTWDEDALVKSEIEIAVQVCGKVRGRVMIPADMTKERAETELQQLPEIQKILAGKTVTKVIFVPGRLVNFIAK